MKKAQKELCNTSNLKIIYLWNEHNKYGMDVLLLFYEIKRTMYVGVVHKVSGRTSTV